jgi:hypothetical protein
VEQKDAGREIPRARQACNRLISEEEKEQERNLEKNEKNLNI